MATATTEFNFSGLAKCLIQEGLLTEKDAKTHIQEAQKNKVSLITYLVANKIVDSRTIASTASIEFGMPFLDLDAIDPRSLPLNLVNEKLIRKFNAIPLMKRGKTLFIGISDPTDPHGLDDIKFQSLLNLETVLVEESKLLKAIETGLDSVDTTMSDLMDSDLDNLNITGGEEDVAKNDANSDIDDAPIVRFVNKILLDAIKKGASDIHFQPYEKNFRIRYRSDGILHQVASPPANISNRIISRIKVMSKMDIAERRLRKTDVSR